MLVDKASQKIICTDFANGKMHDFKLFKSSKVVLLSSTNLKADSGYTGIDKIHSNSDIPHKSSKNKKLTKEQKAYNRNLSKDRVLNENVIGKIKRFKIISDRYRNRRKRFGLRFNLIAGIYNYELSDA